MAALPAAVIDGGAAPEAPHEKGTPPTADTGAGGPAPEAQTPPGTQASQPPTPGPSEVSLAGEVLTAPRPDRGLTNGRGAVNGMGLVNGTGIVNGRGLVNGRGRINGNGAARGPPPGRRRRPMAGWQFLAVLVALVVVLPALVYFSYSRGSDAFTIDGKFGDWDGSKTYSVTAEGASPLTAIDGWSVGADGTHVFLYVEAAADVMGADTVEGLYLFIDSDGDGATGYDAGAVGAEFLMEMSGWNGSVQSSTMRTFDPEGADRLDWGSWYGVGGTTSALSGNRLEAGCDIGVAVGAEARFLLVSQDETGGRAASTGVPLEGGVLLVTQRLADSAPLSGVLPASPETPLLTLEFTCEGAGGTVEMVEVATDLAHQDGGSFVPFSIQPGESVVRTVSFDTSSLSAGHLASAHVTCDGVQSSFACVVVQGHPARAYVGSAPESVHIDGAFGDWYGRTASDIDDLPVANSDIDVSEVGVHNTTSMASFFVRVGGDMFGGASVPVIDGKPVQGGSGTPLPAERKTGEDITRIFIDSDMSALTGMSISAGPKVIGADYRIDVRGIHGEVASSSLHRYSGTSWAAEACEVAARVDGHRLEVGVATAAIGGEAPLDFMIQTTDWRQALDLVALDAATMLAVTGGISMGAGTETWAVDTSATASSATALSTQRKLFHDGTNVWSVFYDGTNTVYKYSTDGGLTWTAAGQLFKTAGILDVSIWYDQPSETVYAIGDTSATSRAVYLQKGTVSPGTSSISWQASDSFVTVTGYSTPSKSPFICMDATGRLWFMAAARSDSPPSYNLAVYRSAFAGTISAWTFSGTMIPSDITAMGAKGSILPTGTGGDVWAVYNYEDTVAARKCSGGSWGAQDTLYSTTGSLSFIDTAPASALVDGDGVLHVVYGDGTISAGSNQRPHIQYAYRGSGGWSSPIRLDDTDDTVGQRYPTISLDTTTGDVYALWVQRDNNNIICKKNVSGTWSFVTIGGQTSYAKQYLTSVYSAAGEGLLCWQWTQNSSSPYHVLYDSIPEFSDVFVPVLLLLVVFIAVNRRRAGRDAG
ncbi:MAG: hypothetical protein AB1793_02255 [Candidatus Thermoplasmatota archaeon]